LDKHFITLSAVAVATNKTEELKNDIKVLMKKILELEDMK